MPLFRPLTTCALLGLVLLTLVPRAGAQPVRPAADHADLGVALRQLNTVGAFMMATAHPDDENNGLLALLSRGQGIRTVLVTATRGDGGQNEIGPELFDALAVLRTEELLAAHRLDGAEQYFTRAVDFGYSFSRDETFGRWGRDEILSDYVRMIRTVRPDVVLGMSPDGEGGGQHHQSSAVLAHEAYHAAADPSRFPDQLTTGLRPWQASKFYFSVGFGYRFRGGSPPPDARTRVDIGRYDPLLGQTYAEIGSHARSMHKCQGMSPLIALPGTALARYQLTETTIPGQEGVEEASVFDGIDHSIEGLARFADAGVSGELATGLAELARLARSALEIFERAGSEAAGAPLLQGLAAVRDLRGRLSAFALGDDARYEIDFRLEAKERQFERAVVLAHGLRFEAFADDGLVTPEQPVQVAVLAANRGATDVVVTGVRMSGFEGDVSACAGQPLAAGETYRCAPERSIPVDEPLTDIHWTHVPGMARYAFDDGVPFGAPFRPTPFTVTVEIEFPTGRVLVEQPVEYRYGDDLFAGEKRTALTVVPRVAVEITPDIAIIPDEMRDPREVRVTVTNTGHDPVDGDVRLELPTGWTATPPTARVQFAREDESRTVRFSVLAGAAPVGAHVIRAVVQADDGTTFDQGYQVVEYPHTGRRHLVRPAEATFKVIDVEMAPDLTVGYVNGVGDAVPTAIEQLGARLEFIDADALAWGDLGRYDVIVTGVRAYERRADLRANNDRLLQYVEDGGMVIVQYNKFEFNEAQYGPYAAGVSRNRVTDPAAPIRVLANDHPLFAWPNTIGAATWDDWVQERGLYFLGDKDPAYVDLIELEDTFEWNAGVKRGALVEARPGRGRWIYVGLGLWRQLPAGTTGAYQLLANLLSLGRAE